MVENKYSEGWQARQEEIDKLMWEAKVSEAESAAYNKGYVVACKHVLMEMKDNENLYEVDGGDMWHNLKNYLSMIIVESEEE